MGDFSRAEYLQTVMKSPQAVTAKDRQAWVGLFARYSLVEDPVGSTPHLSGVYDRRTGCRSNGPLGRFYNTFIAPNEIIFHVDRDIVVASRVVRDLTIEIRMSAKVLVHVPMHLVYELEEEGGELKIWRLAAHWEMMPSVRQQMSFGRASLGIGLATMSRMFRYLGVGGTVGFMRAVRSVGEPGKQLADTFVRFVNGANATGLADLVTNDCSLLYMDKRIGLDELVNSGLSVATGKILASGNFVSASCRVREPAAERKGVAFFEFNMKTKKICAVNFHLE